MFYYFMLYFSSALEFIIERYIIIVYYDIIIKTGTKEDRTRGVSRISQGGPALKFP